MMGRQTSRQRMRHGEVSLLAMALTLLASGGFHGALLIATQAAAMERLVAHRVPTAVTSADLVDLEDPVAPTEDQRTEGKEGLAEGGSNQDEKNPKQSVPPTLPAATRSPVAPPVPVLAVTEPATPVPASPIMPAVPRPKPVTPPVSLAPPVSSAPPASSAPPPSSMTPSATAAPVASSKPPAGAPGADPTGDGGGVHLDHAKDLFKAFKFALAYHSDTIAAWNTLPTGKTAELLAVITVDPSGKASSVEAEGKTPPPDALIEAATRATKQLMFMKLALKDTVISAGKLHLRLSATASDVAVPADQKGGAFNINTEPPSFTLASGRHIEFTIEVVRIETVKAVD